MAIALVDDRAFDEGDEVVLRHDGGGELAETGGGMRGQRGFQGGQLGQRRRQRADVAPVAGAGGEAREQALEILDVAEDAAQGVEIVTLFQERFDGVVAGDDGDEILERGTSQSVAQREPMRRRVVSSALSRVVGASARRGAAGGDEFEIGEGDSSSTMASAAGAEADARRGRRAAADAGQ
jgi:hypothetical protein